MTLARGLHSESQGLETGHRVGAVAFEASDAVSGGFVEEVGADELAVVRCGVSVLVVGHHDDEREVFDRGHVDALVKGTGRGATVADGSDPDHAGFPAQAPGVKSAGHHGHERAEVADHGVVAVAGSSAVDVAVAPAHGTLG